MEMQELYSCTYCTCRHENMRCQASSGLTVAQGQKDSVSSCSASHWQGLGLRASLLVQWQEGTLIASRPAFSLPSVVAPRLWCLCRFFFACPAVLLAHKAGTKFDVLKVLRPELWGHSCSALIQLRAVHTYPSFVLPLRHLKAYYS